MNHLPITNNFSIRARDLKDAFNALPDDAHVIVQMVTGTGQAWMLYAELSDELKHIKWDAPTYQLKVFHPAMQRIDVESEKKSISDRLREIAEEMEQ